MQLVLLLRAERHGVVLEHNVATLAGGAYEVRTPAEDRTTLMVNGMRATTGRVTASTRVHAASPPLGEWFEAVDAAIEECNGLGSGGHS